ncbi:MAG: homoserine kinase [Anaerolineae bacterium]|nr:homoserine kinase [Anaerolineae bacterium]
MANTRAEAFAPATVANLGVGFDILGMAVEGSGDVISVERRAEPDSIIISIIGDNGKLPIEPDKNVATIAANALLKAVQADFGVAIRLKKGLPLASGLGSSSASSVAAAVAVNALLGEPFKREELLPFTLEGEAAVSGYHADNVAPCLLGGITLTNGTEIEAIRKLPIPENLYLALVSPDVAVPTADARAVLPQEISLKIMVHQTGAVAELVDALYRGDVERLAKAMESDKVVEPARAHLIPQIEEVRFVAKRGGAMAVVISGAGPTLCAICDDADVAKQVTMSMKAIYDNVNIDCRIRSGKVLKDGAQVLKAE